MKVKTAAVTVGTKETAKPEKGATFTVGQLPIMAADKTKLGRGWGTRGVRLVLADLSIVGLRQRQYLDRTWEWRSLGWGERTSRGGHSSCKGPCGRGQSPTR